MKFVPFVLTADPPGTPPRVGAALEDGRIVDLQAAHMAMTARLSPFFANPETFREAGDGAVDAARRVVEWVRTENPPGTSVAGDKARAVGGALDS